MYWMCTPGDKNTQAHKTESTSNLPCLLAQYQHWWIDKPLSDFSNS